VTMMTVLLALFTDALDLIVLALNVHTIFHGICLETNCLHTVSYSSKNKLLYTVVVNVNAVVFMTRIICVNKLLTLMGRAPNSCSILVKPPTVFFGFYKLEFIN